MRATDDLKQEHRLIETVLPSLVRRSQELGPGNPLSHDFGEKVLDFLQGFVDECHHGKEERYLFKKLESRGISRQTALPLARIIHESW